jgi:hypothetical protein
MANVVPGVTWQPVDVGARSKRRKGRGLVGHVAVSTSKNLTPGPLATRNADWHFYLPKDGPAIQYIDLDVQCWASGAGNGTMVAFESEGGMGTEAQVNAEPWTDNQLTWAAKILRHLHDTEGVPLEVMPDSLPTSRGFGTHRLGIDPWRVPGGEVWSSSYAKTCPGAAKHAQRAEVVRRAALGTTTTPIPLGDDTMYLVATPDKTVWKLTDYDCTPEPGVYRMGALAKARGISVLQITQEELNDNRADALARRGALLTDIAKAAGGDIDEAAIVAGLLPKLSEALSAKLPDGALSRDDVISAFREVLGDAANPAA